MLKRFGIGIARVSPPADSTHGFDFKTKERLHALQCPFVSNYLISAHALVMGSLANNHFCEIANLFGHPKIFGSANSLMTELVFAVLHRKVAVLRRLTKHCNL